MKNVTRTSPSNSLRFRRVQNAATLVILAAAMLFAAGCGTVRIRHAVPKDFVNQAQVPGMSGIRCWGDSIQKEIPDFVKASVEQERKYLASIGKEGQWPTANFLAISGGGGDGAYAAGLLCGWTASGTRPEFKVVTGISTGALIAPYAFLGPKYDSKVKEVYTTVTTASIMNPRYWLSILKADSIADSKPLQDLAARHLTPEVLKEVAQEHAKGRRLLVGTTNLDAQRPVIWDLGAIASSGRPDALDLFRRICVASASIPGVFSPAYITVEANGKQYDEMHVDGGTSAQIFVYPPDLRIRENAAKEGIQRERKVYVIRTTRLQPEYAEVKARVGAIAGRSVSTLIKTQGIGDLYRIYFAAKRDGMEFNLDYLPEAFQAPRKDEFDQEFMTKLFDFGYQKGKAGIPWMKAPPGFESEAAKPEAAAKPK